MDANDFTIEDFRIINAATGHAYYIREILDWPSHEFCRSKLSPQEKLQLIEHFGADRMTEVLAECFAYAGKSYNAAQTARDTIEHLRQATRGCKSTS